jgi:hypothetical protein
MATEMSREVPIKKALGGTLANKIKNVGLDLLLIFFGD